MIYTDKFCLLGLGVHLRRLSRIDSGTKLRKPALVRLSMTHAEKFDD